MSDTIAGRYTLVDPIARGGSGTVWRAWDQRNRCLCAAKVLRQRDSVDLLRFVREQSVKLEHPHILAPYGWAAEDEHVVIAMDLCDGGTLETVLQDHGAFSDAVIEEIMVQLLSALQCVHDEGWIHRDVKPANVMMKATGAGRPMIRLADFGIATQLEGDRLTRTGMVLGTPGYMAPELFQGADPHPTQDLFAAGVVAMRMGHPHRDCAKAPTPDEALDFFGHDSLLGAEIAALLDEDPVARQDGALALQERVRSEGDKHFVAPAKTREGDLLEIFHVLEPLPPDWQKDVEMRANAGGGESAPSPVMTARIHEAHALSAGLMRTNYGLVATPLSDEQPLADMTPSPLPPPEVLSGQHRSQHHSSQVPLAILLSMSAVGLLVLVCVLAGILIVGNVQNSDSTPEATQVATPTPTQSKRSGGSARKGTIRPGFENDGFGKAGD